MPSNPWGYTGSVDSNPLPFGCAHSLAACYTQREERTLNHEIEISVFSDEHTDAAVELWRRCELEVPGNDSRAMIARKRAFQPDLFLVATLNEELVGTVMAGYEGRRGWINLLAVEPDRQRDGIGRALMDAAETRLRALGCPKINLQIRDSNAQAIAFYDRLGYSVDHARSLGKRLD